MAAPAIALGPLSSLTGPQLNTIIPACVDFLVSPTASLSTFQSSLASLSLSGKQTKTIGKSLMTALPNLVANFAGIDPPVVQAQLVALSHEAGMVAKDEFVKAALDAVVKLREFKTRGGQLITYDSTGER